jgi:hypothetical protein
MSKETLKCEMCSHTWSRKKSRGRKPRFCPQCIKENIVLFESPVDMSDKVKTRKATKWTCPSCGESVTVFVEVSCPPICCNKERHSTKRIEMQIYNRQKEIYA